MAKRSTHRRKVKRVPRNISNAHRITRLFSADIVKTAADSGLYRTFQLLLFPVADLQSLYSQYKINSITLEYQLYNQLNNNSVFPTLYTAPQSYNESTTPASLTEVQQYKDCEVFQFGPSRPVFRKTYMPWVNMVTTGPGRVPVRSPWLTLSGDAIQHMTNVDWMVNYNSTSASTHTVRLVVWADISVRNTR